MSPHAGAGPAGPLSPAAGTGLQSGTPVASGVTHAVLRLPDGVLPVQPLQSPLPPPPDADRREGAVRRRLGPPVGSMGTAGAAGRGARRPRGRPARTAGVAGGRGGGRGGARPGGG